MKRMELIANRSVEDEIISSLEHGIADFYSVSAILSQLPCFGVK